MLGRVRTCSLSSLEVLEMERTPSKLLKDDSLSIYEKTLLKLQQGSQLDLSSIPEESTKTSTMFTVSSNEALMTVNATDCASVGSFPSLSYDKSMIISKEEPRGNLSVVDMFSRYKATRKDKIISSNYCAMEMEDYSPCANISPSHDPQLQEGCIVDPSSPV